MKTINKTAVRIQMEKQALSTTTLAIVDFMQHDRGVPRCDEWDVMVMHARQLEVALRRLLSTVDRGNADTHESTCMCVIHEADAALKDPTAP